MFLLCETFGAVRDFRLSAAVLMVSSQQSRAIMCGKLKGLPE
jgi:hypothetical protein